LKRIKHPEHDDVRIGDDIVDGEGKHFYGLDPNLVVLDSGGGRDLQDLEKIFIDHVDELQAEAF